MQFEIFDNLTARRTIADMYTQVVWAQLCANHVQHNERLSRATCHGTCHVVQRDRSAIKFDRVYNCFYLSIILLAESLTDDNL